MKAYRRSRGIAPSIPNFGSGDEWSDSHPGNFTPGERIPPPQPLNKRLGGPHEWSGHFGEDRVMVKKDI
jgi:hypothetical protein